jgi:hypothetical protein
MLEPTEHIGAQLCAALGLERCVSIKIEVNSDDGHIAMVTAEQYLGHEQLRSVNKVFRRYRLELLQETPVPTPDVEVQTNHLPEPPLESSPT